MDQAGIGLPEGQMASSGVAVQQPQQPANINQTPSPAPSVAETFAVPTEQFVGFDNQTAQMPAAPLQDNTNPINAPAQMPDQANLQGQSQSVADQTVALNQAAIAQPPVENPAPVDTVPMVSHVVTPAASVTPQPQAVQSEQTVNNSLVAPAILVEQTPASLNQAQVSQMPPTAQIAQAPGSTQPIAVEHTPEAAPEWGQLTQPNAVTEAEMQLGAIAGRRKEKLSAAEEVVPGLVMGSNIDVAHKLEAEKPKDSKEIEEPKKVHPKHPLADLYGNLEVMSKNAQAMMENELEAQRRHESLEEMQSEKLGWQITGKVTNVLMILSWVMAIISLFFPTFFKGVQFQNTGGLSVDFIMFIVTIMLLLTCTILTFWINTHKVLKIVTWCVFVFFVSIFVLISLHSGGVISDDIPVMGTFLNRFSL